MHRNYGGMKLKDIQHMLESLSKEGCTEVYVVGKNKPLGIVSIDFDPRTKKVYFNTEPAE